MCRSAAGSIALAVALAALAGCGGGSTSEPSGGKAATTTRHGKPAAKPIAHKPAGPTGTTPKPKPAPTQTEQPTPKPEPETESREERESRLRSAREALVRATSPAEREHLEAEISKLDGELGPVRGG
jgi:hypothetical protein